MSLNFSWRIISGSLSGHFWHVHAPWKQAQIVFLCCTLLYSPYTLKCLLCFLRKSFTFDLTRASLSLSLLCIFLLYTSWTCPELTGRVAAVVAAFLALEQFHRLRSTGLSKNAETTSDHCPSRKAWFIATWFWSSSSLAGTGQARQE